MIREICDSFEFKYDDILPPIKKENKRYVTYEYDVTKENDMMILKQIEQIILNKQPNCFRCKHYSLDGRFGGYQAHLCDCYGCLECSGYYDNTDECPDFTPIDN